MTPSSIFSPRFEFNFAPQLAKSGLKNRAPQTLPNYWVPSSTGPFDFSQGSDPLIQGSDPLSATGPSWTPLPGPQMAAMETAADELFYGGAAGGGKTDLLLGLAITQHWRSIIFRREYPQLKGIIDRSREIIGQHGRLNEQSGVWKLNDDRVIELGSVPHEKDKERYQGRPHSLKAFDEITHFTESQYRFLIGWKRTTNPKERTRVVCAGNPPTSSEGEWVIRYWAPWLDDAYTNKAEPGELRWFAVLDGKDVEVESGKPFEYKGDTVYPLSRTFIPARLADNPYLMQTGYVATLQGMEEPLRTQMLYGDFRIGLQADARQLVPRPLLTAAKSRPAVYDDRGGEVEAAVDVAGPGEAETVLVLRQGPRILGVHPFAESDARQPVLAMLQPWLHRGLKRVKVDSAGIGHYFEAWLRDNLPSSVEVVGINVGSKPSETVDKDGRAATERFVNLKAELYWSLRQRFIDGDVAGLDDPILLSQLASIRYEHDHRNRVAIETKENALKRGVKSPDRAEALMLLFAPTPDRVMLANAWQSQSPDPSLDPWANAPWNRQSDERPGAPWAAAGGNMNWLEQTKW